VFRVAALPVRAGLFPSCDEIVGEDAEDTGLLRGHAGEAWAYLESFSWCGGVLDCRLAFGVGGVVGVFLLEIAPLGDADPQLWVITGDLPPLYLSTVDFGSAHDALHAYVGERWAWARCVEAGGQPGEDVAPVGVEPTIEFARDLRVRLEFLEKNVLPFMPATS